MKRSKHYYRLALIFFLSFILNTGYNQNRVTAAENPPKPNKDTEESSTNKEMVVEVNGIQLTMDELETDISNKLEPMKNQIPQDRLGQVKDQMRNKLIEDFITRILLTQEAEKHNISVSDKETNSAIKDMEKNLPDDMKLETALEMSGMTIEELQKDIAFGLRAKKLIDIKIKTGAPPSEEEIQKYYNNNKKKYDDPEKVHARHILVKVDAKDGEKTKIEKKTKIEALRKKLLNGADFQQIAQENSDCPSKAKGGDLGTFARGRMVKPFEEAAFSQNLNKIGPVVETQFGYHIIQVLEHIEARSKPLHEVKDEIEVTLKQRAKNEAVKKYIAELKDKAKIVYGRTDM